jgi:hypothetical protein
VIRTGPSSRSSKKKAPPIQVSLDVLCASVSSCESWLWIPGAKVVATDSSVASGSMKKRVSDSRCAVRLVNVVVPLKRTVTLAETPC